MSALMSALPASERAAASSTDLDMESFVKKNVTTVFKWQTIIIMSLYQYINQV